MYKPYKMTTTDAGAYELFFDTPPYSTMTFLDPQARVVVPLYETIGGTFYNPRPDTATYPQPWVSAMSFVIKYAPTAKDWYTYTNNTATLRANFLSKQVQLQVYYQIVNKKRVQAVVTAFDPVLLTNRMHNPDSINYRITLRQIGNFINI